MSARLNRRFLRIALATALISIGVFLSGALKSQSLAGVRTSSPERTAFKSGSARSETILREIADTLKRIDARLARLEKQQPKVKSKR